MGRTADAREEGRLEEPWDAECGRDEDDAEGGIRADQKVLHRWINALANWLRSQRKGGSGRVGAVVGDRGGGNEDPHFDIHQAAFPKDLLTTVPIRPSSRLHRRCRGLFAAGAYVQVGLQCLGSWRHCLVLSLCVNVISGRVMIRRGRAFGRTRSAFEDAFGKNFHRSGHYHDFDSVCFLPGIVQRSRALVPRQ